MRRGDSTYDEDAQRYTTAATSLGGPLKWRLTVGIVAGHRVSIANVLLLLIALIALVVALWFGAALRADVTRLRSASTRSNSGR